MRTTGAEMPPGSGIRTSIHMGTRSFKRRPTRALERQRIGEGVSIEHCQEIMGGFTENGFQAASAGDGARRIAGPQAGHHAEFWFMPRTTAPNEMA